MSKRFSTLLLTSLLAARVSLHASSRQGGAAGTGHGIPPPQAAARVTPGEGSCIRFLSIFVPAGGGNYVLGISFGYRDLNGDGAYSPGTDRMEVCVNCADACGLEP